MISNSQAVEILKSATYIPEKKIEAVSRNLIDAGIIPKSRGRRIALMNLEQFCSLLIAIHVVTPGKEAASKYMEYFNLSPSHDESRYQSAGEHITSILGNYIGSKCDVSVNCSIMLMLSHPRISITSSVDGEDTFHYGLQTTDDKPRSYVEIPAATLIKIADLWRRQEAEATAQ